MTWGWRAFFNIIAMFSMIFMLAALAGMIFRSPRYEDAVCEAEDKPAPNKKLVWALGILTVILTAIAIYMTNKKGFFLMTESGKIDWACHANDAAASIHDVLEMGNAVQVAVDFYNAHPNDTLILVTADHETGGMAIGSVSYTHLRAHET